MMSNEEQQKLEKQENKNFKKTAEKNRKKSIKQLVEKMNAEKLRVLQKYLEESNITFDASINDYYKLKKYLKDKLSKEVYATIDDKCKEIDSSFENLINDLSNKSTIGFDKFVDGIGKILKPVSIGLALNTAFRLAPTPVTKLAVGAVSAVYTGYNLIKNNKYKKIITREGKLNEMLQDLEFKYDDDGNLIDTRFSKVEQEIIRNKLKEMDVQFIDAGYQTLRSVLYGLDYDKKIKIVMALSGATDVKKFEKELNKYGKKSLFNSKAFLPVTTVASSALLQCLAALVNGTVVDLAIDKIFNNSILGKVSGSLAALLTVVNKNNPLIQAETLFLGTVIATLTKTIGKIVSSIKKNSANKKLKAAYDKIENDKYKDEIIEEQKKLREMLMNSKATEHLGELAIIEIVTEYIRDNLGIEVAETPKNIYQLGELLKSLKPKDRSKVNKLMEEFDYFNDKPNNQIRRKLEKIAKATGMAAVFGLAGMSVVDIFTGGEFLNDVRDKLFFYDSSIGNYEIESALVLENEVRDASKGIYLGDTVNIYKTTSEETTVNCYINTLLYDSKEFNFGGLDKHGLTPETYAQFTKEMSNLTLNDCNRLIAEGGIIPTLIDSTKESNLKEALTKVVLPYFTKRKQYLDSTFQLDAVGGVLTGIGTVSNIATNLKEDKIKK